MSSRHFRGPGEDGRGPEGVVSVANQPLPYGDPNGWELVDPDTVRLLGSACDQVKLTGAPINIQFPCGSVNIR